MIDTIVPNYPIFISINVFVAVKDLSVQLHFVYCLI